MPRDRATTHSDLLDTLTFGMEFECGLMPHRIAEEGWRIDPYHTSNSTPVPDFPGWKCESDSSLHHIPGRAMCEVISPVLRGEDGVTEIKRMLTKLRSMGGKVNRSCGLHTNVGWLGNVSRLKRLITTVARFEKALFSLAGSTARERNGYSRTLKEVGSWAHRLVFDTHGRVRTMRDIRNHTLDRGSVLNVRHVTDRLDRRRVEFRVFAGTLKTRKVLTFLFIALGLVEYAMSSKSKRPDWDLIKPMRDRHWPDGTYNLRKLFYSCLRWFPGKPSEARGVFGSYKRHLRSYMKEAFRMSHKYDSAVRDPAITAGFMPYTRF